MRLAISNIAWDANENEKVIPVLRANGVTGIELAPTKYWDDPEQATLDQATGHREYWLNNGLYPVAMQSLLFNRAHLSIFGDSKRETLRYLKVIVRLAGWLSINSLVFGSPKNRLIGPDHKQLRYGEAIDFFRELGDEASRNNVTICIEPNPEEYGCDFIRTSLEGLSFIQDVHHSEVKLHLDTGTMLLNQEDPYQVLHECLPHVGHFHISDPFLLIPGAQAYSHETISKILCAKSYSGWVSIEMKGGNLPNNIDAITEALTYVNQTYLKKNK